MLPCKGAFALERGHRRNKNGKAVDSALQTKKHRLTVFVEKQLARFARKHPYLALWGMFLGIPMVTLAAVCGCTYAVVLPLGFLLGWLLMKMRGDFSMDVLMIGGIILGALAVKLLIGFCHRQIQK